MYQTPTTEDFHRNLRTILKRCRETAATEEPRITSECAKAGRMRSGYHIHALAKRFDEIHAEAVEATMGCISDFVARTQLTPTELAGSARPILETLGAELIARIPVAATVPENWTGAATKELHTQFEERLDGALRDIEIGFVGGRSMAMPTKDSDRRALVLRRFYDGRCNNSDGWVSVPPDTTTSPEEQKIIYNICEQLHQNTLIYWKGNSRGSSNGLGKITSRGVDVIEGKAQPPVAIVDNRSYSISHSVGVQIGDGNVQGDVRAKMIFDAVDRASATPEQKEEAKSLLEKVVENQTLWNVIAGMISFGGASPAA